MAVTHTLFGLGILKLVDSQIDWVTGDIRMTLHTSSQTPLQDADDFFDDWSATELSQAAGYTTKGIALTTTAPTYDTGSNEIRFDSTTNPVWTASGGSIGPARYAAVWEDTGGASSTDPLLGWIDFGQDETASDGNTFTVTFDANSAFIITVS